MSETPNTSAAALLQAAEIGQEAGLRYVYAGNLPGSVSNYETTRCPKCQRRLIERRGFRVLSNSLTAEGRCPDCRAPIPGVWKSAQVRGESAPAPQAVSRQ